MEIRSGIRRHEAKKPSTLWKTGLVGKKERERERKKKNKKEEKTIL